MLAVYKKEVRSYFTSPIGYLLIAFLLLMNGIYFTAYNLQGGYSDYGSVLYYTLIVLLLFCPLLTMRILSEDRKQKTDQLLLCAPVKLSGIVWGKFFSALTVFCVPLVVFCTCPLVLSLYGNVNLALAYSDILGYLLLGGACIAIGVFVSSLTENQIVSAVITFAVLLLAYLMNGLTSLVEGSSVAALVAFIVLSLLVGALVWYMTHSKLVGGVVCGAVLAALMLAYLIDSSLVTTALSGVMSALGLFTPYYDFLNGTFSITAVVYYLSVIGLFLFLTVQAMDKRRYS